MDKKMDKKQIGEQARDQSINPTNKSSQSSDHANSAASKAQPSSQDPQAATIINKRPKAAAASNPAKAINALKADEASKKSKVAKSVNPAEVIKKETKAQQAAKAQKANKAAEQINPAEVLKEQEQTANVNQTADKAPDVEQEQTASDEQTARETQGSTEPQPNSEKPNNTPFDFNNFSQFYLNQLNQMNQLTQSQFADSAQPSNLFATNIKMWQESVDFFSHFLTPNSLNNNNNNNNDNSRANDSANSSSSSTNDMDINANAEQSKSQDKGSSNTNDHSWPMPIDSFNELAQKVLNESLTRVMQTSGTSQSLMFDLMDGWQRFTKGVTDKSPTALLEQQTNLWQQQMQLVQNTLMKAVGNNPEPVITPEKGDKRFTDEGWTSNPLFDYLKQSYLLTADSMMKTIDNAQGVDEKTRQRLSFFTRQWLNAVAPSNFLWSNPEVLRLTKETKGQNLVKGLKQLAEDLEKSAQVLSVRMTDNKAFKIGENIATTPGKVVFRNRMFELLQYTPMTDKVNKRPLLIVPPWINKFYIMDLKEKNSYIRWALAQGHSVFVMSWVNPTRAYKDVGMETYMHEGLLTALEVIKDITGEPDANVIGYCIGGMLLALTLSWLTEHKQAERIASATFWTTIFDFSDPGDLGVFIDERIVTALEQEEEKKGVFDGRMMGVAFSLLRENSLYWNYYVQNYLKGERPVPFDLLYWNSDCTNVTAALHSFLLRELYLGNKMIQQGLLEFDGIKIDLSKVTTPTYVVATLQDHIAKWKGSYQATQVLGGNVTFVLGESGHIAGIINPPSGKYGFYTYDDYVPDPEEWFDKAIKQDKSWWLHWGEWIQDYSAGQVDSRQPGVDHTGKSWQVLGDAPGNYVLVKAADALKRAPR